jgi:hypothetical protein
VKLSATSVNAVVYYDTESNRLYIDLTHGLPREIFDALPVSDLPHRVRHHPITASNSTEFWCKDVDTSRFAEINICAYTEEPEGTQLL